MAIKRFSDEKERILNLVQETDSGGESISPLRSEGKKRSKGLLKTLGIIVIVVLVALIVLYGVAKYTKYDPLKLVSQTGGTWQAVFLSNGQVYFGKVVKQSKDTIVIKDIYYLQVNQTIQPKDQTETTQPELSLIKLGNELHGPTDEMRINRLHVLFIEDLKADSRVVTAISNYVQGKK